MNQVIVTSRSELEFLINNAVALAMANGGTAKQPPEFLGITEAAEMVSLAVNTIYGMVSRKEIPFYKRGKKLYFKSQELLNWLSGNRVASKQEMQAELIATGTINRKSAKA